jgi:hypothetical protein
MFLLEVSTLDLGEDVRAAALDLTEEDEEPARGPETAPIWAGVLPALAGDERWVLDFFSHLETVREFCERHEIAFREGAGRSLVLPAPTEGQLEALFVRFERETFGVRAGGLLEAGDAALERDLVRRGMDAYHPVFGNYFFCAVCDFSEGSLAVLSQGLNAPEIVRRVKPRLDELDVEVFQPS